MNMPDGERPGLAEAILRAVGALVVVLDRNGRIVRFNHACERATGWVEAEVRGQPFFELLVPVEQREVVREVFLRLCSGDFPSEFENDWITRRGDRVTIAWRNTCFVDANGDVELVIGTGTDLSAQRRAEAALRAVVQHTPNVAVQIYRQDGTIALWNAASTRMYGWTEAEVVGRSAAETVLSGPPFDDLLGSIGSILRTGQPVGPAVFPVRHRDGREVMALSTVFAIPGEQRGLDFVCMDLDVTATLHLQRALEVAAGAPSDASLFAALVREAARLVGARFGLASLLDESGTQAETRVVIIDGEAAAPFRYPLAGSPCAAVLEDGDTCVYGSGVADAFPADTLLRDMGIEAYVGSPVRGSDGRPLGLLVLMHDRPIQVREDHSALLHLFATRMGAELERERAEARILAANVELERRVRERTADLAAANAELESFSYSVSHDLRAPLRAIHGFAQAIEEDYGADLPAGAREMFGRIQRAGARMGRLIDDLLGLAKVARHPLKPVRVDVSALAAEIADDLARQYPQRRVEVAVQEGLSVVADPGLLRVALENLLGNAWKFTAERDVAHIAVRGEVGPVSVTLHVADDGDGFDDRYASRLFRAFQRLHDAHRFEGTGIGLATVGRIVSRHGGEVTARGEPGRGATFSLTFPHGQPS